MHYINLVAVPACRCWSNCNSVCAVGEALEYRYSSTGDSPLNLSTQDVAWQTHAFQKGFHSVVPASWLTMFNQPQLGRVLNGNSDGDFNVSDLKQHVKFAGG